MRVLGRIGNQVRALVAGMTLLVLVVGAVGLAGVVLVNRTVADVTDRLAPAAAANTAVLQDLTDIETSVRGWAITADRSHLEPYQAAVQDLPRQQATLRASTEDAPMLRTLVEKQEVAAKEWRDTYPRVRLELPAGPGTFRAVLFADGADKFDRLRAVNAEIEDTLDAHLLGARESARGALMQSVFTVALVALLGASVAMFFGRLTTRQISDPLRELGDVVDRLAAGDTSARAVPSGPRETRKMAYAINDFADENDRVRVLEERALDQLRDLDRAKTNFMSNVSHELRTPLTTVGGYVELFEEELGALNPHQATMLGAVKRNVGRLKGLVEDLLTLSETESGAFRTAFDRLDLSHLTSDVAYDMQATAAKRGISISEVGPSHPVRVLGDSSQLSRAVTNLVANAVKFSHDCGEVTITLGECDGSAVVEVADHGIGIPEAETHELATRFFRASNAVDAEITGTGLGLRIVQTIANNHGGRLEITSAEGKGTKAKLILPLRQGNKVAEGVLTSR